MFTDKNEIRGKSCVCLCVCVSAEDRCSDERGMDGARHPLDMIYDLMTGICNLASLKIYTCVNFGCGCGCGCGCGGNIYVM